MGILVGVTDLVGVKDSVLTGVDAPEDTSEPVGDEDPILARLGVSAGVKGLAGLDTLVSIISPGLIGGVCINLPESEIFEVEVI